MVRKTWLGAAAVAALVLVVGGAATNAAPVRLARILDYHAGKITFSYLGDIWTANEDGSAVHRLTDNIAREVYPRFSRPTASGSPSRRTATGTTTSSWSPRPAERRSG
jgi:hypothetical protein